MNREQGNGFKISIMHELLNGYQDILHHHVPPMNYHTCPRESNHLPMKALSQNTQRIKGRLSFRPHQDCMKKI